MALTMLPQHCTEQLTFGTSIATSLMALGLTSLIPCRKSLKAISTDPATAASRRPGLVPSALRSADSPGETKERGKRLASSCSSRAECATHKHNAALERKWCSKERLGAGPELRQRIFKTFLMTARKRGFNNHRQNTSCICSKRQNETALFLFSQR